MPAGAPAETRPAGGPALGAAMVVVEAAVRVPDGAALGFQPEFGLDGLVLGPSPARLDTGGISPHFSPGDDAGNGEQLSLAWGDKETRRQRRGIHAKLVRLLQQMETGRDGLVAQAVGRKWSHEVSMCPGTVRKHKVCGQLSFIAKKCDFPLCPWCQRRRADKARRQLSNAVGQMKEPKLLTLSPPNLAQLSPGSVAAFSAVFTRLMRRSVMKDVRGAVRSIETTNKGRGWNLHIHVLLDGPWMAQYPTWDIAWVDGRWRVAKKHPGLARVFTDLCQKFVELRSPRLDFDLENPDHWYFIDVRQADSYGSISEVLKYIAKGTEIVALGAGAVVDFLMAIKGRRMIQGYGSLFGVDLDADDETLPTAPGECPYLNCMAPAKCEWEFQHFGPGDHRLVKDSRTGLYRILPRDGPGVSDANNF